MFKRILITGGSGLLGVNLAFALKDSASVFIACHMRFIEIPNVRSEIINLSSFDAISLFIKRENIDLVINAAGYTNVEKCEQFSDQAEIVNTKNTSILARACHFLGAKLVHISTDHLFDGSQSFCSEDTEPQPLNTYARTKREGEIEVQVHCPNSLIVRTNFFGWGPSYRRSFSDFIIDSLKANKPIFLFTDVFFTPISIGNLINIIEELLLKESRGIFNVVGDDRISKYDFGLKIAEVFGLDSQLIHKSQISSRSDLVSRPNDLSLTNLKVKKTLVRSIGSVDYQIEGLLLEESNGLKIKLDSI
jgi:dTDP-4-dehydrorhamnose reductase